MEDSYISVVLLPNEADSALLCACSGGLCGSAKPVTRLDPTHTLPHITVARFQADVAEASDLWQQVQPFIGIAECLTSGGLCFAPNTDGDKTWATLELMRSRQLEDLQRAILATDFAHNRKVDNKIGDAYNPHCTLALVAGTESLAINLAKYNLFRREFTGLRLAVGQNGPHQSLTRVLYT